MQALEHPGQMMVSVSSQVFTPPDPLQLMCARVVIDRGVQEIVMGRDGFQQERKKTVIDETWSENALRAEIE